ncbi:MAG: deoxyguanosinetriphosphate triphosphohydrolase [Pseudomonadota bacterium]
MSSFTLFEPQLFLAPYASSPEQSRGRQVAEPPSNTRNDFARDRDRILHSTAWRRLKHKTQVFIYHEGDHYRTRLTHSLEVAQIARSMARQLGLSEDLAEAIALSHDIGHPPFGHAGEEALNQCMAEFGGFDHNAQALRIVTQLEQRYANFDGLNLTWETLEGLVKHNGPLSGADIPTPITKFDAVFPLNLSNQPGPEAQVAAIADDIAYNAHDIDDGLRARLFSLDELTQIPLIASIADDVNARYGQIAPVRRVHEIVRRVITVFVEDALEAARDNLTTLAPKTVEDIHSAARPVIALSPRFETDEADLKAFLRKRMYHHHRVKKMTQQAQRIVRGLFEVFMDRPQSMPPDWAQVAESGDAMLCARAVADFVAGMTDRYAISQYHRHVGPLSLDL